MNSNEELQQENKIFETSTLTIFTNAAKLAMITKLTLGLLFLHHSWSMCDEQYLIWAEIALSIS